MASSSSGFAALYNRPPARVDQAGLEVAPLVSAAQPGLEVRATADGKGLGVFAVCDFGAGDRLLAEAPLLSRSVHAMQQEVAHGRIEEAMAALQIPVKGEDVLALFAYFDPDESGAISFQELNTFFRSSRNSMAGSTAEAARAAAGAFT